MTDRPKPRLKLIKGMWYCWTPGYTGLGFTVKQAYEDWRTRK